MPGVLTNVTKGSMLTNVDTRLSQRTGETADLYRARLEELRQWFAIGKAHVDHAKDRASKGKDEQVARDAAQEQHVRDEFFGDNPAVAFFPGMAGDSEDHIVRGAYIQAITLALEPAVPKAPKPIVSYWIINGRKDTDSDAFEVFVTKTPREIHVLMLTPLPVNVPPPPAQGFPEDMFVVATTARIQEIDTLNPYTKTPIPLPGTVGVDGRQVWGY